MRVATLLAQEPPSTAAFHAQQAAEKAVKASRVMLIDDVPRMQVINFLLDELAENGIAVDSGVRDATRVLERFYAPTRTTQSRERTRCLRSPRSSRRTRNQIGS